MSKYTYEQIRGLVAKSEQQGATLHCTFRCTLSAQSADSVVAIKEQGGVMQRVQDRAKSSVWYSIRRSLLRSLRNVFGYGMIGRLLSDLSGEALGAARTFADNSFSESQLQDATVRAFEAVAHNFRWDDSMGQLVWAQQGA